MAYTSQIDSLALSLDDLSSLRISQLESLYREKRIGLKSRFLKPLALSALLAVYLFAGLNLVLSSYFSGRTWPNTKINQYSVGSLPYSQVATRASSLNILPASVKLGVNSNSVRYLPAQLGLGLDSNQLKSEAQHQSWLPVVNLFASHNLKANILINEASVSQNLLKLESRYRLAPTNASIIISGDQFALQKSHLGSTIDVAKSVELVRTQIKLGQAQIKLPTKQLLPQISDSSLSPRLKQLNDQLNTDINFVFNGNVSKVSVNNKLAWYQKSGSDYIIGDSQIRKYVQSLGSGFGIRVANADSAVTAAKAAMSATKPLNYSLAAVVVPTGPCANNNYAKLILVNISAQHMYACQGSSVVNDSAITSGAYLIGDTTPKGTWRLSGSKARNIYLNGPTWHDFVSYWLPFYSDYGFHDASWQTFPFGSSQYATDGSHGCIHVPLATMAWLYQWSGAGTVVTIN